MDGVHCIEGVEAQLSQVLPQLITPLRSFSLAYSPPETSTANLGTNRVLAVAFVPPYGPSEKWAVRWCGRPNFPASH